MKTRISSEPTPDEKHRTPSDIFSRFARRSLALNRSRTIVSIIGIALSCALITAIFTSVTTLLGGLRNATLQREGSWQVEVQNISDEALEQLHGDERAHAIYELNHYGSALLPVSFDTWSSRYLNIDGWPTSDSMHGLYPAPELTEGRAPDAADEIVLPSRFKDKLETDTYLSAGEALIPSGKDADAPRATWDGTLDLNSTINLAVGKRTWHDAELNRDRPCLDRESLYYEMKSEGLTLTEWVDDVATPQEFTVVGFYVEDDTWMSPSGALGFVSSETALPVRATDTVLTTNLTSRADIEALIEDYTGVDHGVMSGGWRTGYAEDTIASTHDGLLRYQGMVDDRAIWGTLYTMAAILSGVVIVASVSLIYNAFAISVSERTRQYGLLASLGASQRQIRRTVYAEALILAVIGIPLGLALGIAGTWIVFQIAGEGIGLLIDSDFYASTHMVALSIEPTILAISAVLALVTVFISAAVPAWRASRISAIDAIRQARDIRTGKREQRTENAQAGTSAHARKSSLRARLAVSIDRLRMRIFGVPGWLAHRNLSRVRGKGRVAVASLAVSVALIIISGCISHYMESLVSVVDSGGSDIRIQGSATLNDGETTEDLLDLFEAKYDELSDVKGAEPQGYSLYANLYSKAEPGILNPEYATEEVWHEYADTPESVVTENGSIYTATALIFVDDGTWRSILEDNDLDEETFCDPEHPVALGQNGTPWNGDGKYGTRDLFTDTGTMTLLTRIVSPESGTLVELSLVDGEAAAVYENETAAIYESAQGNAETAESGMVVTPLEQVVTQTYDLPIGAILPELPNVIKDYGSIWTTAVLPVSALPAITASSEGEVLGSNDSSLTAPFVYHASVDSYATGDCLITYNFNARNARAAGKTMEQIVSDTMQGGNWVHAYLYNNSETVRTNALMSEAIQLFILCFIVITVAIAVANVFNTLSSSIMLRRREFAMLKSGGMEDRALRRMLALECAPYAWHGLAIGLALGAIVSLFIWNAMTHSFLDVSFTVPLVWVVVSFAVVMGVLVLSTVYALKKSRAHSIIETLRDDAI